MARRAARALALAMAPAAALADAGAAPPRAAAYISVRDAHGMPGYVTVTAPVRRLNATGP